MFSCEFCEIFNDIFFYRPRLLAASENLRDVFVQEFLSLCHHLIYFHSYSFAPNMEKVSSNMVFSNVSLNVTGYRKKCIVRKHS